MTLRCAIYTRKSTEEGLEQDFNSLQAQREACEAFITSQKHEGWQAIKTAYDDGGFSGGNMARPGLKLLMEDIAARKVNVVVVYKVDRLTRSLADFAKIIEQFDKQGVSFVSVTQQFNTTSSMGRLTLNVLLSFAQFEREVTGERIRDKIAASKKKGMWMGGSVPLGYEVKERKLLVKPADAETVRQIYRLYLELGSVRLLQKEVEARGVRSVKGYAMTRGALYTMLSNPIYVGRIRHKKQHHEGLHEAIIDPELWEKVQQAMSENRNGDVTRSRKTEASLLAQKLFDETGEKLVPVHALKKGKRYRYYISQSLKTQSKSEAPQGWRLAGQEIEQAAMQATLELLRNGDAMTQTLLKTEVPAHHYPSILNAAKRVPADAMTLLTHYVQRVELQASGIRLTLSLSPLLPAQANAGPVFLTQDVPMQMQRRGVEMRLVIGQQSSGRIDTTLIKAIARAHRWFQQLATGQARNIAEIAKHEAIDRAYATRVIYLAFLAPDIIESILAGNQPADLSLEKITKKMTLPIDWQEQRKLLGFS